MQGKAIFNLFFFRTSDNHYGRADKTFISKYSFIQPNTLFVSYESSRLAK